MLALPEVEQLSKEDTIRSLEWNYKKVHWGEVVGTLGLGAAAIGTARIETPVARWEGINTFDTWFRDGLALDGTARQRIDRTSDAFALTLIAFPVLVDSFGVALAGDRNKEVFGQLFAIQAQAFAMTGFLTSATKVAASRERPYARDLDCDPSGSNCGDGLNASFFSGHTAFAFTGAGLTCVAHRHLDLLGGVGDPLACAGTLTLASATAIFRVMADAHWMTDVLTGAGVGLFSGWLMPKLLHFRHGEVKRMDGPARALRYLAPYGSRSEFGIRATGTF